MAFRCGQCGKKVKRVKRHEYTAWYPFCTMHCAAIHGVECGTAELNGERAKLRFQPVSEGLQDPSEIQEMKE